MALSAYALCSLEDAKDYLNVVSSADDVAIERIINAMTTLGEKETGRELKTRTHTDIRYSGTGSALLRMKQYPVTSVTAISFLTSDAPEVFTAQSLTDYPVVITGPDDDTLMYRNHAFERGASNIKVTYVAGLTTIPDSLKEWALQGVMFLWKKKDRLATGIASQSFQGQTTSYIIDLKKAIDMDLLDPYRRYAF